MDKILNKYDIIDIESAIEFIEYQLDDGYLRVDNDYYIQMDVIEASIKLFKQQLTQLKGADQ